MKFVISALLVLFATISNVNATLKDGLFEMPSQVSADSNFGKRILSQARLLNSDGTFTDSWVSGYSLVFQGCHHISQWNDDASDEQDVRIATKRLVRFRLCSSDTCNKSGYGCTSNYGDYIIDMNTYLSSWFQAKQDYQSFQCDYLLNNVCNCDNDNNNGNNNKDECLWDCYSGHNMQKMCMQNNPYGTDDASGVSESLNIEQYMQCAEANLDAGRRKLADAASDNGEWDGKYYIGPYCVSQGGSIFIGMFTDDACSNFADSTGGRQTFYDLTTTELPYGDTNVVDLDCLPCKEPTDNNNGGNDSTDTDTVTEVCESLYTAAGKCESYYTDGVVSYPNNNACNYMKGIKIVRKDGTVITAQSRANKTASVFIGVFVVSFILLAAYSYYLKTRLDRASINLSE